MPQELVCCMVEDLQACISVYSVLWKVLQKQKLLFCLNGDELELDHWPSIGILRLLSSY
jgi:hypothetical protein